MKHIKRLFILIILTMLAVVSIIPTVKADEVAKSKTASELNKDFDTTITLTLNPKTEETRIVDVVLVGEGSCLSGEMGQNFIKEASVLIDNLNQRDNIQANIAIVVYGVDGNVIMDFTDAKNITKETLANKLTEKVDMINANKTYSNLQNGLILTKAVLDASETGSKKEDRYVVLLTDGSHFTYNNGVIDTTKGQYKTASAVYKVSNSMYLSMGNMDANGDVGSGSRNVKSTNYYAETGDYGAAFARLMNEYDSVHEVALRGYDYFTKDVNEINSLVAQDKLTVYTSSAQVNNIETYPYLSVEIGTVEAAKAAQNIKDAGYNIFTIGYLYEWGFDDVASNTYILKLLAVPSYGFVNWMGNISHLYLENTKNITSERFDEIYGDLEKEMFPKVEKDTYLIDEMGFGKYKDGSDYDFEFVNDISQLTISIGGRVLGASKIRDNVYGFGEDASLPDGYQFVLTYYENGIEGVTDNECIKLAVNTDIKGGEPIDIEYHEVLGASSRRSDPGSYAGLNTSNSTIVFLANGTQEEFEIPQVSYDVRKNPNTADRVLIYSAFLGMSLLLVLVLVNVKKQKFNM